MLGELPEESIKSKEAGTSKRHGFVSVFFFFLTPNLNKTLIIKVAHSIIDIQITVLPQTLRSGENRNFNTFIDPSLSRDSWTQCGILC